MSHDTDTTSQTLVADRYLLGRRLGGGGMSQVYAARDQLLGRDVAVKLFRPAVDAAGPDRQRAEMRTLAQLSHPRLVALHDAGSDHLSEGWDRAYLVMELVHGPSLATVLRDGPLSAPQTARIGAGVAEALDYIHGRGIVHRDVKPPNILLDRPYDCRDGAPVEPRLADFGIAQTLGDADLTQTGLTIGTAAYLSPEQVRGAVAGPASDIYALGLVLLECLTGRREYPGTTAETALARLTRPPRIEPRLPDPWPRLLLAMTSQDPDLRPSAAEVATALERGVYGSPAPAAPLQHQDPPPTTVLPVAASAETEPGIGRAGTAADNSQKTLRTRLLATAVPAPTSGTGTRPHRSTYAAGRLPSVSRRALVVAGAAVFALLLVLLAVHGLSNTRGTGSNSSPRSSSPATAPDPAGPGRLRNDLDRLRELVQP